MDLAISSLYVPPIIDFTEYQHAIDWLVKITNPNIVECPLWDGSPWWEITRVPFKEVNKNTVRQ